MTPQILLKHSLRLTLAIFLPSYSMNLTNSHVMRIQTNDNQNITINIKNDLLKSKLYYLLKRYCINFNYYKAETPIRLGWSAADLALFIKATHAIRNNISQCNFTDEEAGTLLDMALALKALDLYVALLGPCIPNKEHQGVLWLTELNQHIGQLLLQLDNTCAFQTPQEEFVQKIINQTIRLNDKKKEWNLPDNTECTHDKKYFITNECVEINIYDAKTNTRIKTFESYNKFTVFPTKNLILIYTYAPLDYYKTKRLFLYDIDNNKLHTLLPNLSDFSKPRTTCISPHENYIATCYNNNVLLWNISNLHNIIEYKQPHNRATDLAFSPNNTMLISAPRSGEALTNTDELRLWTIDTTGITCVAKVENLKNINLFFGKKNETFMIEKVEAHTTQQFHIQQNNNNYSITPSEELGRSLALRNRKNCNEFFYIHDEQTNKSMIYSLSQGIIQTYPCDSNSKIKSSHNNKHIICAPIHNPEKIHITHLSNNVTNLGTKTCQLPNITSEHLKNLQFNQDDSLILLHTLKHIILYDTYGNCIKGWHHVQGPCPLRPQFHPFGNALITGKKLFSLYDLNARPILTTLAQNLTIGQYALLKKACKKKSKEGEIMKIKENSLDHHTLKTMQNHEQKLLIDQLYLKITQ